jgi:predicted AAA+ superfamily ATPase
LAEAKPFIWPKADVSSTCMAQADVYPRFASSLLEDALADTPVVLVHGPRQSGKTTLARMVGENHGYAYVTFDDDTQLAAATIDPAGFVANLPAKVVLDEVQRVPQLFLALKATVDRDRRPGRFILTGSSNVLLVPKLADSLAGRMEILRLHPLSQCELARAPSGFLDSLFSASFSHRRYARLGTELSDRIVAGGFPAALARTTQRRRSAWYRDYVETLVQRDVRNLARIASLDALPRLLQLAAGQTARLLNVAELGGPFQLSRPTIRDYTTLLERIFLLEHLPPWHSNRLGRLVKTPKLHLCDTGLAAAQAARRCGPMRMSAEMPNSSRNRTIMAMVRGLLRLAALVVGTYAPSSFSSSGCARSASGIRAIGRTGLVLVRSCIA